ncbi:MAG: hypothetical protein KDD25_00435 [Bdellovibrionales bacterium]|nr:hypothetical protein [Bdellovibrionales bacterium]
MRKLMLLTLSVLALGLGTACAKKSSKSGGGDKKKSSPTSPGGGGSGSTTPHWSSGASATLFQTNGSQTGALEDLADIMGLDTNTIEDLQVNLEVEKIVSNGQDLYSGDIRIGWKSRYGNSTYFQEVTAFASNDAFSAKYNKWVAHAPDDYIKLFFEFTHGSMIFVGKIDNDLDLLSGRVYVHFHDYDRCSYPGTWPWIGCGAPPITIPQNPPRHCWTIYYYSPTYGYNVYDCRDYIQGSGSNATVNTAVSVYPNFGRYQEIGRFETLVMTDSGLDYP